MHRYKYTFGVFVLLSLMLCVGLLNACSYEKNNEDSILGLNLEELAGQPVVDLRDKDLNVQQYQLLKNKLPDSEILWNVPLQGETYSSDICELTLTSLNEAEINILTLFPNLKQVSAEKCPDYVALSKLAAERPDLQVKYHIPFCGESVSSDATALTIPGNCLEEAVKLLPLFHEVTAVSFAEPLPEAQQIAAMQTEYPEITFSWNLNFHEIALNEKTETLDLTGVPVTVEEVEKLIAYLPKLTWLDMSDCGIDNEQMDALNRKYEQIKIVWTVSIGDFIRIKTDTDWFMAYKFGYTVDTEDVYNLRYCTDIVALDLGHMKIKNCDFVAFMPHLKYLILADTKVTDLTPLTGLKELAFLELFMLDIKDYAPLESLTGLEDLNLYYTFGDPNVILRMTWLKNLWWNGCDGEVQLQLRETMPDCKFSFNSFSSTGAGWRKLPNYYAQRDMLGLDYATG